MCRGSSRLVHSRSSGALLPRPGGCFMRCTHIHTQAWAADPAPVFMLHSCPSFLRQLRSQHIVWDARLPSKATSWTLLCLRAGEPGGSPLLTAEPGAAAGGAGSHAGEAALAAGEAGELPSTSLFLWLLRALVLYHVVAIAGVSIRGEEAAG